ncbi:hypothetical protein COCC4DRAFT_31213 [Bipolaris maydis ATCC 48331]|uniref:Uncharacterized protein n=1 Tax=Cochliobolus heterostrophus (strain C4 / ATCC 48331 / race T) TaxID=665024 RepID=N4XLB6_COCH4|nr:uncharacterized protein COCC4DRAFT_31213 [Bipolaris maydis ATCC 48331]ENI07171.1 hypothetical protein COCC4DRAFT_31213 [Bipolaris maydis ATCC 48331]
MLPTPLACTHPPTVFNHANPSHFRPPRTFNLLAYTAAAVCDAPRSTTSGCWSSAMLMLHGQRSTHTATLQPILASTCHWGCLPSNTQVSKPYRNFQKRTVHMHIHLARAVPNGCKQLPGLRPLPCISPLYRATIADDDDDD